MGDHHEQAWLEACQRQFELHLKWGPISRWSQRDFENLSELISEKTGILVSVTTLKRALGRVRFKGMPFHSTLNAMVQFLGHSDWAHFKSHPEFLELVEQTPPGPVNHRFSLSSRPFWVGFALLALLNTGFWILHIYRQPQPKKPGFAAWDAVQFHSQDGTSDSIPHQVNVEYAIPPGLREDLLLVSFGDGRLDFAQIDSSGNGHLTHRYTDYGYYPVKLFSNRRLVSLIPVLITNPTWLVAASNDGHRDVVYVKPALREGVLTLREKDAYRFVQDTLTRVSTQFRKFRDFGADGDNCTTEFRIRCPANASNTHTPKVHVKLSFKNETAHITLDNSNTARNIYHKVADYTMPVAEQLRIFRQDVSDWSVLSFETKNKTYRIRLNDKLLYEGRYNSALGALYGMNLRFVGIGEIDHILVYNSKGNLVFKENF